MASDRAAGARVQSLAVLAIRIGGAVLQMLLVAVVALRFPVEDVGLNGLVWSIALVARMAGTFGLDTSGVREQAPLWAANHRRRARMLARRDTRTVRVIWSSVGAAALVTAVAAEIMGYPGRWLLVFWAVATASAFARLFMVQRMARQMPVAGQFLESVALPFFGLAAALTASFTRPELLIPGQIAAFVLTAVIMWWISPVPGRRMSHYRDRGEDVPRTPWRVALPLGMGAALTALCVRGPMFVLSARSLAMAGTYDVAQRIQSAGAMGTSAVTTVFSPRIAVSVRDRARLWRLVGEAAVASAILPALLLIFLLVAGERSLVALLGEEYSGTWGAAVILVISTLINATTSATSNVLMLGGYERWFMRIAGVQLLIVVGGAWLTGADTAPAMAVWVLVGEVFRSAAMATGYALHLRSLKRHEVPASG
ncbi:hypothetical protein FCK90_09345 [Kocuria coralli]|uniref:Lipopolysaccharide biosynthesis protein n=1 Tax=Kocuria coralli TaxID=1461025 RepID=A0A5J5KYG5_9MICC|nr:hypothetical protein [Kocuria coralli]KAA9393866.1 hypothetical protein FCK90_09345 [Kocuria coralli]